MHTIECAYPDAVATEQTYRKLETSISTRSNERFLDRQTHVNKDGFSFLRYFFQIGVDVTLSVVVHQNS